MEQVPEADAAEQAHDVLPVDDDLVELPSDPEVPEADAAEQAQSLPYDDDEERP